jgi:hypothetical protein
MLDLLIPFLDNTLDDLRKNKGVTSTTIKRIYIQCAKTYVGDFILYAAFRTPLTDLFYEPVESESWQTLLTVYTQHEFADNNKVVNAYKSFYNYIAIGNAMLSQQKESDMAITKMFK